METKGSFYLTAASNSSTKRIATTEFKFQALILSMTPQAHLWFNSNLRGTRLINCKLLHFSLDIFSYKDNDKISEIDST